MIGVDIRFMSFNMKEGIISSGTGLFCADVLKEIREDDKDKIILIIDEGQKTAVKKLFPEYTALEFNRISRGRLSKYLRKLDELRFEKFLKNNNIQCLWFPFANPNTYVNVSVPVISTVHDLITIHDNPMDHKLRQEFKRIIEESNIIVTISEYVKSDILKVFAGVNEDNIRIIPNPVKIDLEHTVRINELSGKKYLLDINAYQNRKNPVTLLKAYAISGLDKQYDLVFCGGYNEGAALRR